MKLVVKLEGKIRSCKICICMGNIAYGLNQNWHCTLYLTKNFTFSAQFHCMNKIMHFTGSCDIGEQF